MATHRAYPLNTFAGPAPARVFALSSGTEGVGKTTLVANLAAALALAGKRVTVVGGDGGLTSLTLLLGVSPQYTLADFFAGKCQLSDTLTTGPFGLTLVPVASRAQQVMALSQEQKIVFLTELDALAHEAELVLVDPGCSRSDAATYFTTAAHEIVIIVTPDPTSPTAASSLIQGLATTHHEKRFWLLANQVRSEGEARVLYDLVSTMALRFANAALDFLGWIPHDRELGQAVAQRQIVMAIAPDCPSAHAVRTIARRLAQSAREATRVKGGLQFFFRGVLAASLPSPCATGGATGQADREEKK